MANLEPTQSSADILAEEVESEPAAGSSLASGVPDEAGPSGESLVHEQLEDEGIVQHGNADDMVDEMGLGEGDHNVGMRVKVYELRQSAWFDRGTGRCKGVYDDQNDVALLMVEAEELLEGGQDKEEGPGGFLTDELLLNTQVGKDEDYSRQQDTLIVWTDTATQLDIALSFQDPSGCEDIWQFIMEVQRHLRNQLDDDPKMAMASSSSPVAASPVLTESVPPPEPAPREHWQQPSLANLKEHEMWLRMQAKSSAGRERAVEHIIGEDYIKQLIGVLNQAEDLESIPDLHALCSLMQTILLFNDNGIFEYILQDDIFTGVLGMLEYDPEFPTLKASYRAFFQQFSKFREVVEIKDETIRHKIHQTSRLLYLKDVVLARMLDDPTFGILNSFVFFNQVDITGYIQSDEMLLHELFIEFRPSSESSDPSRDAKKHDLVQFLHQLMIMGKGLQVPGRLTLYRTLLDRGLLFACEWAFQQGQATILHAGAEILTLAVEHDVNAVRLHVLREEEASRQTLVMEIIGLLQKTQDQGLIQQMVDTMKTLLEPGAENEQTFGRAKEISVPDSFSQYFYDLCASHLFAPINELPELKEMDSPPTLTVKEASLLGVLVDLLSYCVTAHAHKAQYYILSNPLAQKVCSLVYAREKTLRHSALRFIKASLKTNNHFVHRNFTKNGVTKAILDLVDRETERDTMLSSACLDTFELIRKESMKAIIVDMFEKHEALLERLSTRPYVRPYIYGLKIRWAQFVEPPPEPPAQIAEAVQARSAAEEEEAWFNQSDEEEDGGRKVRLPAKRKRLPHSGAPSPKRQTPPSAALGLDYDDDSGSEGSAGGESPKMRPSAPTPDAEANLADGLSDVEQKIRAKRLREEEEDDGVFASLVGAKEEAAETPVSPVKEEAEVKDKKIKLSLGSLGRTLGGKV